MDSSVWLKIASKEIGVRSFPRGSSNPRITEYHQGTNIEGYDDKVAWCSSFANWVLSQAGIKGTGSALAKSWLEWGDGLVTPRPGCLTVLAREGHDTWKGHVGFFIRKQENQVVLLGGNQLDEVREHNYPLADVLAYRWPSL